MDKFIYTNVCRVHGHQIVFLDASKKEADGKFAANPLVICANCGAEYPFVDVKPARTSGPSGKRRPKPEVAADTPSAENPPAAESGAETNLNDLDSPGAN
jgi:hypothetical protein